MNTVIHGCVNCECVEQLADVKREYENAAKTNKEAHSATVVKLEASHAATITGISHYYLTA